MNTNRYRRLLEMTAGLTVFAGCSGAPQEFADTGREDVASAQSDLFVKSTVIWQNLTIPVCWDNPDETAAAKRTLVKDQVTNTWQKNSQVKFTGWGTCASANAPGVHIKIDNSRTSSTFDKLGRQLDGVRNGLSLNVNMHDPQSYLDCTNQFGADRCLKSTLTHEFGHVLGFAHEEVRFDELDGCIPHGDIGDVFVGDYDRTSIMHSCNVFASAPTSLSSTDKLGLQAFYGHPSPSTMKKDALVTDEVVTLFFFGKNMTRYYPDLDLPDQYAPFPISSAIDSWPTAGPFASGVDAAADFSSTKAYLFSGSQYTRLDKAGMKLDYAPRELPGGWNNWPAHWNSVTAAIKWTDGKLYLFRGNEFVRLTGTTVDNGYPQPISNKFNIPYTSGFDYAFIGSNGKGYFFKGPDYVRVTITNHQASVDANYPRQIVGRWPGVTF